YRLSLEKDSKKVFLQGWAVVENTSDEDWSQVRLGLVSGRPISFQMDLYEPLYVPRPTVEPELFASLRPQTYGGGLESPKPPQQLGQAETNAGSAMGRRAGGIAAPAPASLAARPEGAALPREQAAELFRRGAASKEALQLMERDDKGKATSLNFREGVASA